MKTRVLRKKGNNLEDMTKKNRIPGIGRWDEGWFHVMLWNHLPRFLFGFQCCHRFFMNNNKTHMKLYSIALNAGSNQQVEMAELV